MSKEEREELGLTIGATWTPLEKIRTKEIYDHLRKKRYKTKSYKPKHASEKEEIQDKEL